MTRKSRCLATPLALLLIVTVLPVHAAEAEPASRRPVDVLRQPLPAENLSLSTSDDRIAIAGPTFVYTVDRATGGICSLVVKREGAAVVEFTGPVELTIDGRNFSAVNVAKLDIVEQGPGKVVLRTSGVLEDPKAASPAVDFQTEHTFYSDGVVATRWSLTPRAELTVREGIACRVPARGRFTHGFNKRRDTEGMDLRAAPLPQPGKSMAWSTPTSCVEAFSSEAALAVFTDRGGVHLSKPGLETASIEVTAREGGLVSAVLSQHVARIEEGAAAMVLPAREPFVFRTGIAVAPNRLPHPRWRDLRMFICAGDAKNPYPSEAEILDVARLGYNVFQMHRLGTPGLPRGPEGELERVIETVHRAGMLFQWAESADLMYALDPKVVEMLKGGKWKRWQGFNYGGRYTASMDPYCDTLATCLASPNGLAEYRVSTYHRMFEKYAVDGMYVDDNLGYANCPLWREHGHPQAVYDCLFELHEVNWARRRACLEHCPHAVLADHCTWAIVLPIICDFDMHLYGEGYGMAALEDYWAHFGSVKNLYGQGVLTAGDSETARCPAEIVYNYDLLTGGGQYMYLDWRLYPKKFPHASGVTPNETLFLRAYNPAQYYFGMYESTPFYFATSQKLFTTTTPGTYATLYRNDTWGDWLVAIANMAAQSQTTSLVLHDPAALGLDPNARWLLWDVNERSVRRLKPGELAGALADVAIAGQSLKLFFLRRVPKAGAFAVWGGRRLRETWDAAAGRLRLELDGPATLNDVVVIEPGDKPIGEVRVGGQPAKFFFDPAKGIMHGRVTYGREPTVVEATAAPDAASRLPEQPLPPDDLTLQYFRKR
jgi:hypothetical protein